MWRCRGMIYTKKANFPYPVLMNLTDDYQGAEFELDVTLRENLEEYILDISWFVSSEFINNQLKCGNASLILVIRSKDNQFHTLKYSNKPQVRIKKSKLCMNTKTVIQLMIQTNTEISFKDNDELNPFYEEMKADILVEAGMILGFSNTVIFDGSQKKPYDLFEKKVDKNIKSDIEIRLGEETILVVYKEDNLQFADLQNSRELNYPYLYMGLQKALIAFLIHSNPENPEEGVQIAEMEPPENSLDSKLYSLMYAKNITELTFNNMDEVICKMSDRMMLKYADAIRGMHNAS